MGDEGRAEDDAEAGGRAERLAPRSVAEWTTLGISAVVVAALVGAALVEVFLRDDPAGARISVEIALEEAETREGETSVPFTVRNDGANAAKEIVVVFEILQGETVVEETTVEFALLASHGVDRGVLVTAQDLKSSTVSARVGAMQTP